MISTKKYTSSIATIVLEGLRKKPKQLPSWLFYDEAGDRLFQSIMRMPEYYLTDCEFEILQTHREAIHQHFTAAGTPFDLVELGAGDGLKTELLLTHFEAKETAFTYIPVDVSKHVLDQLKERLTHTLPPARIRPVHGKNEEVLRYLDDSTRKIFLFLGSNIGNFTTHDARIFLQTIAAGMKRDDLWLIGFDLKKDPRVILAAYNDAQGITADFNFNLLLRLNRELGAQFDLHTFDHYPYYDPETGITKSFLVSTREQDVYIDSFNCSFHFDAWETIHTEVSVKYNRETIEQLAAAAGMEIVGWFYDARKYFCNVLLRKQ